MGQVRYQLLDTELELSDANWGSAFTDGTYYKKSSGW
jgi:hypothetical protein